MNLASLFERGLFVALLCFPFAALGHAADIWLSPAGNDDNPGTKDSPVKTLARAKSIERAALVQDEKAAVTVWLNPGEYPVDPGWTFDAQDSGAEGSPVVWRATETGKARLVGCRSIAPENWKPLNDPELLRRVAPEAKNHLQMLDLAAAGFHPVTAFPDYSREPALGLQLYFNDERLPLSRWPDGAYGYTTMEHVLKSGSSKGEAPAFIYRGDEPARWITALNEDGVWLRGFWRVPWEASTLRVDKIEPSSRTITFSAAPPDGIGSKYSKVENGERVGNGKENWFALNLLEEINRPGEWAIDFKRGRIYLWPPESGAISISENRAPLVTFSGANHVEFRGLVLGWNDGEGVHIEGGDHIGLVGCKLRQIAGRGVVIEGGTGHFVLGNDIYDVGLSAIDVSGGDRKTLTSCADEICNNLMCRVALNAPVPAMVAGLDAHHQDVVGVHVAHNRIDGASYGGFTFAGNDNIFEYNEVCRVGLDGGDLGGFYTTGGWTSRGNVVRYNFIHDSETANGIYMDDGDSGLEAYGNLVYKVNSALFIGGGHDNHLQQNLVVDCQRAIHVDDRGVSRKYTTDDPRLRGDFNSVPIPSPAWSKYPGLVGLLQTDTRIPSGNVLEKNIAVHCGVLARKSGSQQNLAGYAFQDNFELPADDIFVAPENGDFCLKDPNSLAATVAGFEPVPFDKIGLQVDANRLAIPARDQPIDKDAGGPAFDSQQDVDSSRKTP